MNGNGASCSRNRLQNVDDRETAAAEAAVKSSVRGGTVKCGGGGKTPAPVAGKTTGRAQVEVPKSAAIPDRVVAAAGKEAQVATERSERAAGADQSSSKERKLTMLINDEDRMRQSTKPAIQDVKPWIRKSLKLEVDGNGDCYCTSWVLIILLWAVQSEDRLVFLEAKLDSCYGGAFRRV
ncbi:unnamed protein product, partial [Pylaiella littoralis]